MFFGLLEVSGSSKTTFWTSKGCFFAPGSPRTPKKLFELRKAVFGFCKLPEAQNNMVYVSWPELQRRAIDSSRGGPAPEECDCDRESVPRPCEVSLCDLVSVRPTLIDASSTIIQTVEEAGHLCHTGTHPHDQLCASRRLNNTCVPTTPQGRG